MRRFLSVVLLISLTMMSFAKPLARKTLEIYYVDVEGGAATLIVSPLAVRVLRRVTEP